MEPTVIYLEDLEITPHKRRILKLRLEGVSIRDIAEKFCLSEKTIEAHINQIYQQYEVSSLLGLAIKMDWLRVSLKNPHVVEMKPNLALTSSATA